MNLKNVLLISVLMVIFAVSGCTTTETITLQPQCTPPSEPSLPSIDRGAMWDALGDEQYRQIENYINDLWAYADEQAAMLRELCNG